MSIEEEQAKDDFLTRLSTLAYAKPSKPSLQPQEEYDQQWFFILPEEYAESNKHQIGIQNLPEEPSNTHITELTEEFKTSIGDPVYHNMQVVSSFILDELSPALLGMQAGVEQALSVLEHTVGAVDNSPFITMELLTKEIIKLKLAKFLSNYYKIPQKEANNLVDKIMPPKQREIVVPVQTNSAPVVTQAKKE